MLFLKNGVRIPPSAVFQLPTKAETLKFAPPPTCTYCLFAEVAAKVCTVGPRKPYADASRCGATGTKMLPPASPRAAEVGESEAIGSGVLGVDARARVGGCEGGGEGGGEGGHSVPLRDEPPGVLDALRINECRSACVTAATVSESPISVPGE